MKRTDLINYLIKKYNYTSYLEIGVRNKKDNFIKINCNYKYGVDPNPKSNTDFIGTSDEFFKQNDKYFDIFLIDGDHTHQQVKKDILNSLDCLNEGGTIVCHDMNPQEKINQEVPQKVRKWNGNCWMAWADLRRDRPDLSMHVVDTDHGLGVIQRGEQKLIDYHPDTEWDFVEHLQKNREKILNLISVEEFYQLYE